MQNQNSYTNLVGPMSSLNLDVDTNVLDHSPVPHAPVVKAFSDAGNAFIEKYSHPPSAVKNYSGIPDLNNFNVAPVEWRNLDILTPIGVGFLGPDAALPFSSDNYLLLTTSGARVTTIAFSIGATPLVGVTIPDVVQDLANTKINRNYNFTNNWLNDVMSSRMAYGSVTTDLNATAFADKGLVTTAQFRPTILYRGPAVSFVNGLSERDKLSWTKAHANFSGPKWDRLFKRTPSDVMNVTFKGGKTVVETPEIDLRWSPDARIQIFQLNGFDQLGPTNPGMVLQSSRKAYGGKACNGTFSVQRYVDTSVKWMDNPETNTAANDMVVCYACHRNADGSLYFVALLEPAPVGTGISDAAPLVDTMWHEMTWVWTLYSGVVRTPNLAVGDASMASPIVKRVHGYEIQPSPQAAFNAFMQIPAEPDLAVLNEAARYMHAMPDGVESKYNFLGSLAGILKGALPVLKPFVKRFARGTAQFLLNKDVQDVGTKVLSAVAGKSSRRKNKRTAELALARSEGAIEAIAEERVVEAKSSPSGQRRRAIRNRRNAIVGKTSPAALSTLTPQQRKLIAALKKM